jgi:hypothetical protein
MKRILAVALLALVVMAPYTAIAGPTEADTLNYNYWRIISTAPGLTTLDPSGNGNIWAAPWAKGAPPGGTVLPAGQWLVLGRGNLASPNPFKRKIFQARIDVAAGAANLQLTDKHFGYGSLPNTVPKQDLVVKSTGAGLLYELIWQVRPQPQWEWVAIKNNGANPITLASVNWWSTCPWYFGRIPSLTAWGILILVLLLAGTAVWIVRKRKPALSM